ncbi:MAG TPA: endolytic transglycosylase MltG, partial [Pseudonocardia sp.]|nr:endolytic transglycosylase MltG [Pseudonocardia sp.]
MTGGYGHGPVDVRRDHLEQRAARVAGHRSQRRRRRRLTVFLAAAVLLVGAVAGGGYYLYTSLFGIADYEGEGTGTVFVQVAAGATTTQIAQTLTRDGVVASVEAFNQAAAEDERIRTVQPGYYQMRAQMSGESAVAMLLDPASRVGQLEIRGGVQLDDTLAPDGTVVPGVLTL